MKLEALKIPDVQLIVPKIHSDDRGFFSETYNARAMKESGIDGEFVQDNQSMSVDKGVVRGLHFQSHPNPQAKLVRVLRGSVFDVAVDIRKGSPTFGQHVSATLTGDNWKQIWIPVGFAHGFCTLEPNTEVLYKVTGFYAPDCDFGLAWDDPELGIEWPIAPDEVILSDKDRRHPRLAELPAYFEYGN